MEFFMNSTVKAVARKSPEWLKNSVMYQVFLRSFTPEGTLKAAEKKLPELAALGVDILYLCPICLQDDDMNVEHWSDRQRFSGTKNPKNPYRIKDFYNVDPEYGTDADLHSFVAEVHRLGMKIILDIVFYHCGPKAVFIESNPDFVKRNPDGSVNYGHWHFPELNYASAGLREYLWKNLEYWMTKFKVDGYRCDVSDAVPLDFWETARERLEKINPDTIILAEGHRKEDQLKAFDLNYNFPFSFGIHALFNQGRPASSLRDKWEEQAREYPEGTRFIRYTDNHDIANDTSFGVRRKPGQSDESWQGSVNFHGIPQDGLPADSRIEKAWGHDAAEAALVMSFMMDGVPMFYSGQEIGDYSRHSIYDVAAVDWSKFSEPYALARRALCTKLCGMRHKIKALSEGSFEWVDNSESANVLTFKRVTDNGTVMVAINISKNSVKAELKTVLPSKHSQLLASSGAVLELSGGVLSFQAPAFGYICASF